MSREGERVELSDIKETDQITILGRKKSAEGDEFVADSIHVNISVNNPAPYLP